MATRLAGRFRAGYVEPADEGLLPFVTSISIFVADVCHTRIR
jgi:hypothetical protein